MYLRSRGQGVVAVAWQTVGIARRRVIASVIAIAITIGALTHSREALLAGLARTVTTAAMDQRRLGADATRTALGEGFAATIGRTISQVADLSS